MGTDVVVGTASDDPWYTEFTKPPNVPSATNPNANNPTDTWTAEDSMEFLERLYLANSRDDANQTAAQILNELSYDEFAEAWKKKHGGHSNDAEINDDLSRVVAGIQSDPSYARYGEPTVSDTTNANDDKSESSEVGMIDYGALMEAMEASALRASKYNRGLAKNLKPEITSETIQTSLVLDEALRSEMDRLYPGMRQSTAAYSQEALSATRKAAAEFYSGEVPKDVQDYQKRLNASLGISRGVFGTAPNYALAQNLGLNSLDMKKYGTQLYAGIPSMSAQILANARTSMPAMNQLPQLYEASYAREFSASAMPTGAFSGSIASAFGQNAQTMASNYWQQQAQDWAEKLSATNIAEQRRRDSLYMDYYNRALDVQQQGQYVGAGASIVGAGLGALGNYYANRPNNQQPTTTPTSTGSYSNSVLSGYSYDYPSSMGSYTGGSSTMFPSYYQTLQNNQSGSSGAGGLTSDDYEYIYGLR